MTERPARSPRCDLLEGRSRRENLHNHTGLPPQIREFWDNGCLTVVPGSHRGPIYSLFDGKTFSGKVCADARATALDREIQITGKAGSVCLMHTRLLHGSRANESGQVRGLYICVYSAADAFPIARNPMPNPQEGMIVRGEKSRVARLMEAEIELPEQPKSPSFFTVIGQDSAKGSPTVAEEDTR